MYIAAIAEESTDLVELLGAFKVKKSKNKLDNMIQVWDSNRNKVLTAIDFTVTVNNGCLVIGSKSHPIKWNIIPVKDITEIGKAVMDEEIIYIVETDYITIKLSCDLPIDLQLMRLEDELSTLTYCEGIETWKVTEELANGNENIYFIRGLTIDIEDGIVLGSDMDDIIFYNDYILKAFLESSVETITHEGKLSFKICFKNDTYITIEGLEE